MVGRTIRVATEGHRGSLNEATTRQEKHFAARKRGSETMENDETSSANILSIVDDAVKPVPNPILAPGRESSQKMQVPNLQC